MKELTETLYFIGDRESSRLANFLRHEVGRDKGLKVLPPIEDDFEAGERWFEKRERYLKQATICILVLGYRALDSKMVLTELHQAKDLGVPVIGLDTDPERDGYRERHNWFFERYQIPIVTGAPDYLAEYLRGLRKEFGYQAEEELIAEPEFQIQVATLSDTIALSLQQNPETIRELSPRQFEEFVAELMEKAGYEVTLTQESRDNGVDIYAVKNDSFGRFLTVVDCKKYRKDRTIGIEVVRGMIGTLQIEDASHAMLVTTSGFSSVCKKFEAEHKYQIYLRDHSDIVNWAQKFKLT